MKIAIIMDALHTGGAERQAVVTAAELLRTGHQAELVIYHPGNDFSDFIAEHRIPLMKIAGTDPLRWERTCGLVRYLRHGHFDVVHAFSGCSSVYGRLAAHLAGVRCIFGGFRGQVPQGRLSRFVNRLLTWRTAGWIVNSNAVARAVIQHFHADPARVFILPNAIYNCKCDSLLTPADARRSFDVPPEAPVVSIIANLLPVKNHAMFLRAARRIAAQVPATHFLLAGEDRMKLPLVETAQEYGLADCTHFLGRCERIADLLRASEVVLLTSLSEGLPNSLIEAGAAGVPCVSTRNGGAEDVIVEGRTGFLVEQQDDVAMAARTVQLLTDRALHQQMSTAASEHVRDHFSPQRMVQRLLDIYKQATNQS